MAARRRSDRARACAGAVSSHARIHQGKGSRATLPQRLSREFLPEPAMSARLFFSLAAIGLPVLTWGAGSECAGSPRQVIKLCVSLQAEQGRAIFTLSRLGRPVLAPSTLGLDFVGEP